AVDSVYYVSLYHRLEDRRNHPGLAPHDQRIEVGDATDQLCLAQLAHDRDLTGTAQALEAVFDQRVGDQDPRHLKRYRAAAATPCTEAVTAATPRPSAGAMSSSSSACSI